MTTILILYYFGDYFEIALSFIYQAGTILERKGMDVIFFRKRAKKAKKGKIFENLGKNLQNFKIFLKRVASCMRLSHA